MAYSQLNLLKNEIINKYSEIDIASKYLNIKKLPCVIKNPTRIDNSPSLGIYLNTGNKISYYDFSTKDSGNIYKLLTLYWNCDYKTVYTKILEDFNKNSFTNNNTQIINNKYKINIKIENNNSILKCKIRQWKEYDIKYWEEYGVSLKALKIAEVYPISHKIIIKNNNTYIFPADKYAYAFVEHKDNNTTIKIYQPFNKKGFKWCNKHDKSVLGLWNTLPEAGDIICICSSVKDALCLRCNTGIPTICVQGEGYNIKNSVVKELKNRFKRVCVLFDNDEAGLKDAKLLCDKTKFDNIVLPKFNNGKDISDYYKTLKNKEDFKKAMLSLFY